MLNSSIILEFSGLEYKYYWTETEPANTIELNCLMTVGGHEYEKETVLGFVMFKENESGCEYSFTPYEDADIVASRLFETTMSSRPEVFDLLFYNAWIHFVSVKVAMEILAELKLDDV